MNAAIQDAMDAECGVLSALCCARMHTARRCEILRDLAKYKWRKAEHEVIFDALLQLRACSAADLQHELPDRTTIMGFPEVNWADYLRHASGCECESLVEGLAAKLLLTDGITGDIARTKRA